MVPVLWYFVLESTKAPLPVSVGPPVVPVLLLMPLIVTTLALTWTVRAALARLTGGQEFERVVRRCRAEDQGGAVVPHVEGAVVPAPRQLQGHATLAPSSTRLTGLAGPASK